MNLSGLHFLLTYKCNAQCGHCFLSCGPDRSGEMTFDEGKKYIDESAAIPSINYFYIEGGEPFLNQDLVARIIEYSTQKGYWIGVLSNGYWAKSVEKGMDVLRPMIEAGLQDIGISTDAFHQKKVPFDWAANAAQAAKELGISSCLMATSDSQAEHKLLKNQLKRTGFKIDLSISKVRGRGRGAAICQGKARPWANFVNCSEKLADPGRVHVGPKGAIHLCQGLLLGEDARKKSIGEIFAAYYKKKNVIVEQLLNGGPAASAKFAISYGFVPNENYVQGCQLCFETRCFLRNCFPQIIGPAENY